MTVPKKRKIGKFLKHSKRYQKKLFTKMFGCDIMTMFLIVESNFTRLSQGLWRKFKKESNYGY